MAFATLQGDPRLLSLDHEEEKAFIAERGARNTLHLLSLA